VAYRLSQPAEEDVIQIFLTGAANFGIEQAERYHDGLEHMFAFLAEHPRAARERHELRQRSRVFRYKAHLIFYRRDGEDIFIQRIRHGHEDWLSES